MHACIKEKILSIHNKSGTMLGIEVWGKKKETTAILLSFCLRT